MWSPQARAAAAAARRRKSKGHTTSARHIGAKYTVTAQHPGKHSQFKAKAKKVAKYTAVASAVGTAGYVATRNQKLYSGISKSTAKKSFGNYKPNRSELSNRRSYMSMQKQGLKKKRRIR